MEYWTMDNMNDYFKQFDIKKMAKKSSKKTRYYNIPVTFDTETTNAYYDNVDCKIKSAKEVAIYKETHIKFDETRFEKISWLYCWQMSIDDKIMFGRTWIDLQLFLEYVKDVFKLSNKLQMVVYVRNLAFEFQFLKSRFNFTDIFANDSHKIIYGKSEPFILKCSYFLAGCSLEETGKNLIKYKAEKKVGDLDYDLIRHSKTPMSEEEINYCLYDVIVDSNFIRESMEMEKGGSILKLPLTKTGYVRRYCKRHCLQDFDYINTIRRFKYDKEYFEKLLRCYAGAFTHANAVNVGKVFKDVHSQDFTSSYPYCFLSEKYPMSYPKKREIKDIKDFYYCLQHYACCFDITYYDIEEKEDVYENIISKSKCLEESLLRKDSSYNLIDYVENNGRIVRAKQLSTTINEIDYANFLQFYNFKTFRVGNLTIQKKDYLPKKFLECIIHFYKNKTQLKGVAGKEQEYAIAKSMLNSVYGMCVTNPIRDKWLLDENDDWCLEKGEIEEMLDHYNNSRSRFVAFEWGIWCTSYARRNLFTAIKELGGDYIYSDTDSVKYINYDKHKEYFEKYNKAVEKKLKDMCEATGIEFNELKPKTIEGKEKLIGVWDYEGKYERFKTLGCKRYAYEQINKDTGKLEFHTTCSGMDKKLTPKYLLEQAEIQQKDVFEIFDDMLYIPCDKSGRLCHTYCEHSFKYNVVDYMGIECEVEEQSYVHLEPSGYGLSICDVYKDFLLGKQTKYQK